MALGFGGYYSICAGCSRGPALAAIARPDPNRDELDVAELLCYPDPAAAPRDGDYFYGLGNIWYDVPKGPDQGSWTMDDWCRSGVLIDLPEKHGYIAFVKLANGRIGYDYGAIGASGEPATGGTSTARRTWGTWRRDRRSRGRLVPCSITRVRYPGEGEQILQPAQEEGEAHASGLVPPVVGSCFDEGESLLYVLTPGAILMSRGAPSLRECVSGEVGRL